MAGGGSVCRNVGENVQTKPGNTVGPASQGLNTRFGIYNGPVSASDYPPDLVTTSSNPAITYDDSVPATNEVPGANRHLEQRQSHGGRQRDI